MQRGFSETWPITFWSLFFFTLLKLSMNLYTTKCCQKVYFIRKSHFYASNDRLCSKQHSFHQLFLKLSKVVAKVVANFSETFSLTNWLNPYKNNLLHNKIMVRSTQETSWTSATIYIVSYSIKQFFYYYYFTLYIHLKYLFLSYHINIFCCCTQLVLHSRCIQCHYNLFWQDNTTFLAHNILLSLVS